MFGKKKSEAEKRDAFQKQIFHERQAGHYSERAGKAKTWEEREVLMKQAQREIEKADYFEAERMDQRVAGWAGSGAKNSLPVR